MIPSPIRRVLSSIRERNVRALLMGGQACVLYGAAEFSRDTDLAILASPANLETSIPADESVRGKTLVILSSAAEFTTFPPWMERQVRRVPRPRRMRLLGTAMGALEVARLDGTTLRIRPEHGFMDHDALRIVRGPSRRFHPGDEVVLSDLRVRVREVTADGRPAVADLSFAVPLEDPSFLWTRLQAGGALLPWSPPAVGEGQTHPSIEPRPR